MQEACSDIPTLRRSVADVGHGFSREGRLNSKGLRLRRALVRRIYLTVHH